ncbi:MAG: hypothetical protein ABGZ17_07685 [Planctomycetaceae bacterium]
MTHLEQARERSRVKALRQFDADRAQVLLDEARDRMMDSVRLHVDEVGAFEAMQDGWVAHWMLNGGDEDLQARAREVMLEEEEVDRGVPDAGE